jgi:hypothetical protein
MKNLKVYVDVFGHLGFMEKFPDDEEHDGLNEMLKEMVEQGDDIISRKELPGFYMAEMDTEVTDSWDGLEDDTYMTIKELKPIEDSPLEAIMRLHPGASVDISDYDDEYYYSEDVNCIFSR